MRLFGPLMVFALIYGACPRALLTQEISKELKAAYRKQLQEEAGTQHFYSKAVHGEIDWVEGTIYVSAFGAVDRSQVYNQADERVQARKVAIENARHKLAEIVLGVKVVGEMTVQNSTELSGSVMHKISGFLKNSRPIPESDRFEEMPDGSLLAQATVALPIYGLNGLIPTVLGDDRVWEELSTPQLEEYSLPTRLEEINELPKDVAYTGLIVDCSELGVYVPPAIIYQIITPDRKIVYGPQKVPRSVVLNGRVVRFTNSYSNSANAKIVGKQPLIVSAVALDSDGKSIIISQEDANKVMTTDLQHSYLHLAKVLIKL